MVGCTAESGSAAPDTPAASTDPGSGGSATASSGLPLTTPESAASVTAGPSTSGAEPSTSGPDVTGSATTGATSGSVTYVLTAVEQASPTLLAQSVTVLQKRLADIPGSTVDIGGSKQLTVTGPASQADRIRANLDSSQLNFRPVINLGPSAKAGAEGTGAKIPVQPSGAGASDWLKSVAGSLSDIACDQLEDHTGPSDPERQLLTCDVEGATVYLLDSAIIEGTEIESAKAEKLTQTDQWSVTMLLDAAGLSKWSAYTGSNIGAQVAFVLDSTVVSAPSVQAQIDSAATTITGGFTEDSATALANGLNAGALPLSFTVTAG